ncbi:hypothetical protein HanIR_Chr09g0411131 [Helianthus annuus]|nr:hypothetical protein HanIR_Chr09g0411131 [Helianthus annuus]
MGSYGKLISIRFTDVYFSPHHFVPLINSCVLLCLIPDLNPVINIRLGNPI